MFLFFLTDSLLLDHYLSYYFVTSIMLVQEVVTELHLSSARCY